MDAAVLVLRGLQEGGAPHQAASRLPEEVLPDFCHFCFSGHGVRTRDLWWAQPSASPAVNFNPAHSGDERQFLYVLRTQNRSPCRAETPGDSPCRHGLNVLEPVAHWVSSTLTTKQACWVFPPTVQNEGSGTLGGGLFHSVLIGEDLDSLTVTHSVCYVFPQVE